MIVQRFIHWLETAPASRRADATRALGSAFLQSELSSDEAEAADAAMTLLLDDPSPKVRLGLADTLANSEKAPRHIILGLANDRTDIAMQVLARSPVLLDGELVDLMAGGDAPCQVAVACRRPLSSAVSAAIVEVAAPEACLALLQNRDAKLTITSLRRMAERLGHVAEIRNTLLKHPQLPSDAHQVLIASLGDVLGNLVKKKGWMRSERVDLVIQETCERATSQIALSMNVHELPTLVNHLRTSGQLTPAFLLRALCSGNLGLFEAALSSLTELPANRVHAILVDHRVTAFKAIYDKAGLPASAYFVFATALEVWREAVMSGKDFGYRLPRMVMDKILASYEGKARGAHDELLTLLRRLAAESARESARSYGKELGRKPAPPKIQQAAPAVTHIDRPALDAPVSEIIVTGVDVGSMDDLSDAA